MTIAAGLSFGRPKPRAAMSDAPILFSTVTDEQNLTEVGQ
jgi:hypothetical protein